MYDTTPEQGFNAGIEAAADICDGIQTFTFKHDPKISITAREIKNRILALKLPETAPASTCICPRCSATIIGEMNGPEDETAPTGDAVRATDPTTIIAGIRQFGLAADGSDLRDLEAALASLRAAPQWRTIDSAPQGDDDFFLVCGTGDERSPFVVRGSILKNARRADTPSHLHLHWLTHWLPLPSPPEQGE